MRCGRLRSAGGFLGKDRWEARRRYWTSSSDDGPLRVKSPYLSKNDGAAAAAANPMTNPASAMEGMMGNASFMIQNMIMMQTIQHFFSGFVLLKVPFGLTKGFKAMFQRGVDLPTLDVSYVSSVSWYFLVMFGMRGLFRLLIGDPSNDDKQSQMVQNELGNAPGLPPPVKGKDAFKVECDNLEIAKYSGVVERSERELLGGRYPKAKKSAAVRGRKGKNRGDDIFGDMEGDRKRGMSKEKKVRE